MSILIDEHTTYIIQGITGREAVAATRECLQYGSKIVGGVTPGRKGRNVHGVPVYDSVKEIVSETHVDCSLISVPVAFAKDAAFEAISNGIRLVVLVTERIPKGQVVQVLELAQEHRARVIGPNTLGLISPGKSKIGGIGGPAEDAHRAFTPGPVGIMSRSGGMTTEISNTLTAAGLGQSTAVSIGGDPIIGTTYAELLPEFEADPDTEAIVIYTEPGGTMEAQLANHVRVNGTRLPIIAYLAGRFMDELPGMRFGHAGTIVEGKQDTSAEKIRVLAEAGIPVAEDVSEIPDLVKKALASR